MRVGHYILAEDGRTPVLEPNLIKYARWFEAHDRRVAQDVISGVTVSTVFLGLDHRYGEGSPLVFETMVFGHHPLDLETERYSTWEEAEAGHAAMVQRVKMESPT